MQLSKKQIEKILNNWNLGKLKNFKKAEKGVVNHNWIITTNKGKYVLRGVVFFRKLKDVKFELKYLEYLKNKRFPYKIPAPILTKNKKLFIKIGKNYFWVYKFIEGRIIKTFDKQNLKECAKMMAIYHKIIEKSNLNNKKGNGDVFNRKPVLNELQGFYNNILKKSKQDKKEKIFLKEASILIPLLKRLDGKDYSKIKKYPLHRDINPENTLWKNEKLVGIIDFENVSTLNDTIIKDIAGMLQYSCRDKKHKHKLDLELAEFFIKEYKKYHPLSKKEIEFLPDIITAGSIEDFSYVYWMLLNDPKRAKLYRLKLYSKVAQWYNKNKIIKKLLSR